MTIPESHGLTMVESWFGHGFLGYHKYRVVDKPMTRLHLLNQLSFGFRDFSVVGLF